jgi:hypothetical protein
MEDHQTDGNTVDQEAKPMAQDYRDWLREDISKMVNMLDLTDLQKHYLMSRWLDQVIWMEGKATHARDRYFLLRRTTIIGGAIVPALVGLNAYSGIVGDTVYWLIFAISLTVAVSAAVEEFHSYSERWRHYRSIVEELKIIGWQFFQLSGDFREYETHQAAYKSFVDTIEQIMQKEVEIYISRVVKEQDGAARQGQDAAAQRETSTDGERAPILS